MKIKNKNIEAPATAITIDKKKINPAFIFYTGCILLISCVAMYFHEMWRDEYQSWLISSHSGSLSELFSNIHYEGHPAGWYMILYFFSGMSSNPATMQFVHLAISITSILLILRYAPLSLLEKILLVSGYFFIYEYSIISRNYSISILLVVLILIQITRPKLNPWLTGIFLFALCNTNLYGGIVAAVIAFYLFLKFIDLRKEKKQMGNLLIVVAYTAFGLILLYKQILPASLVHANDYYKWKDGLSMERIIETGSELFNVFFAIPSLEISSSFGINIFKDPSLLKCLAILIVLLLFALKIKSNKKILLTFLVGTIVILIMLYFNNHTSLRHEGFLYVVFIISMWLFRSSVNAETGYPVVLKKIFLAILIVQSIGGLIAIGKDILYPFSNFPDAARYVVKNNYDKFPISGMADYMVSPFSAFTHKPVYVPETGKEIYYIVWDDNRLENDSNYNTLLNRADSIVTINHSPALIILSQALSDPNGEMLKEGPISPHTKLTLIKSFNKPNIVGDENYFLYLVNTN